MPPISSERFEEVHKALARLLKETMVIFKDSRRILRFFRGRLTALNIQLARLTRKMKLLEEFCKLPNADVDEVSSQLLARQVIRLIQNR